MKNRILGVLLCLAFLPCFALMGGCNDGNEPLMPQDKKVELAGVYQNASGDLMLSVSNAADIFAADTGLDISIDNGATWHTGWVSNNEYSQIEGTVYFAGTIPYDNLTAGQALQVKARLSQSYAFEAGVASNVIEYTVKSRTEVVKEIAISSIRNFSVTTESPDKYVFADVDGTFKLMKTAVNESEGGALSPVELSAAEKLDFEYKFVNGEDTGTVDENGWMPNYGLTEYENSVASSMGWKRYDYNVGITSSEYNAYKYINSDEVFHLLIRVRESETATRSAAQLVTCTVRYEWESEG